MGFWVAIAGIAASLIGTGIQVYAASEQADAQRRNARVEEQNRLQEAESIRQSAAFEERQYRRRIGILLGKQNALAAASGLDISSGSPLLAELDNVRQGELEALNIRRTGVVGATAREYEAKLARYRASGYSANYAVASGLTKAAGTILGGWSTYMNMDSSSTSAYVKALGRRPFQPGISQGE